MMNIFDLSALLGVSVKQPVLLINRPHDAVFDKETFFSMLNHEQSRSSLSAYLSQQANDFPLRYQEATQEFIIEQLSNKTSLMRHVSFFTNHNGRLSYGSVLQAFYTLGFKPLSAHLNTVIVVAGAIAGTGKLSPSAEDSHELMHNKSHTGLFNQNTRRISSETQQTHQQRVTKGIQDLLKDRKDNFLVASDIPTLVDNLLNEKLCKSRLSRIFALSLRPLQIVAFTNLLNMCGGRLTTKNLEDFYAGTLFYVLVEPSECAKKIIELRRSEPDNNIPVILHNANFERR